MTQAEFRNRFLDQVEKSIPGLKRLEIESMTAAELVSPYQLELPSTVLEQARTIIDAFFALREHPESRKEQEAEALKRGLNPSGNYGLCMSYDFHLNDSGDLKLIEINTNAAFMGLGWLMYQAAGINWPVPGYTPSMLRECIEEEIRLVGLANKKGPWIVMDENPSEQKLRLEFHLFKSWFEAWGKTAQIKNIDQVDAQDLFVYNRYTDFYLQEDKSKNLRALYNQKQVCFSPQPMEYMALADKERLVEWSLNQKNQMQRISPDQQQVLKRALLSCELLTAVNSEDLWQKRRQFFFKPLRAYGGKQSYRGSSISRRHYDELIGQEILAQEFVPAPERKFEAQDFKFDLRFYAFKGELQGALARLYQGQLTNLKTPGGGFTPIRFS